MKPEQEALLKVYDAFKQAIDGVEATHLHAIYETKLEEAAQTTKTRKKILHNAVARFHPRWVRANLPHGFPKKLDLE